MVEKELRKRGQPTVFVRIAALSLREVLSANIIEQSRSLFGTSFADIQAACRTLSTRLHFGEVTKAFFAHFTSRSLQFLTDKEVSNYVGPDKSFCLLRTGLGISTGITALLCLRQPRSSKNLLLAGSRNTIGKAIIISRRRQPPPSLPMRLRRFRWNCGRHRCERGPRPRGWCFPSCAHRQYRYSPLGD